MPLLYEHIINFFLCLKYFFKLKIHVKITLNNVCNWIMMSFLRGFFEIYDSEVIFCIITWWKIPNLYHQSWLCSHDAFTATKHESIFVKIPTFIHKITSKFFDNSYKASINKHFQIFLITRKVARKFLRGDFGIFL